MWPKIHADNRLTQLRLWFGFLGSAVAWFIHFVVVYYIAEAVCIVGLPAFDVAGIPGFDIVVGLLTAVAVAVCLASGWIAYQNRQHIKEHGENVTTIAQGAGMHMARSGLYLSAFFAFITLAQLFPLAFLRPCP